ncbi:pentatricopeptide repeat-containing protein At2g22410, mitochondrial-like [Magnolia sinica]|uniref:pentatricopeptide repeat-containing protein At2g22410, mitochondrial-like n=1 Tax=Magnolia sinica TaxID=86752 RepID=UPI00265839A8|nr:pentatricopeptide repeat-containing protein At2g22410, mitochondrial-like [Magnolia sinica]
MPKDFKSSLLFLRSIPSFPKHPSIPFPQISFLHTCLLSPHDRNPNATAPRFKSPLLSLLQKSNGDIRHVKQIHAQMILTGLILHTFASSQFIAFCVDSNFVDPDYRCKILVRIENPNAYMWNITIRGFSESEDPKEALLLYMRMLGMGCRPDNYTFPLLLKASARLFAIKLGVGILGHVWHLGFDSDVFVRNAAIHMFAMCHGLEDARRGFDGSCVRDLVSWNSMINGYVWSGRVDEALKLFQEMEGEGVEPDEVTMIGVVSSCAQLGDLELERGFHHYIEERGLKFTIALSNALMDMYVKCGSLEQARLLFDNMPRRTVVSWTTMVVGYVKFGYMDAARECFDEMPERDVVMWNSMIAGYVQHKRGKDALALFQEMQAAGVKPNGVAMVSLLSACAQIGALETGIWVHHYIDRHMIPQTVALGMALVDMYAKCGKIEKSLQVFEVIPERKTLTWTTMIGGLAIHGRGRDAISYFMKMIDIGLTPDEVTFVEVLSACCHAGLVDEGHRFFDQMSTTFGLSPKLKHYSCMVDLLGRAGLLDEG